MKVSIIIPNYNGEALLEKNLPRVFDAVEHYSQKTNNEVEVIIVDDTSTDKSVAFIRSQQKQVRLLENEKNYGFSTTANKGVKEAHGDVVILLNTDVVPQKDFLEPLIVHFNDPKIFAVGCMDKSIEDGKTVLRGRGLGNWERGFLVHSRGEVDKTNTLWVSGGSSAFRKSIWQKLGGFNSLYNPFYWEDIDLCYRALKSGYVILFEPKSIVIHEHEKGAIKNQYSTYKIKTIAYRNQFIFEWKNATDLSLQLLHIFWLPYHFIETFLKGDFAFILGFFQAIILLPKIIHSSFEEQKFYVKTDKETINTLS